MDFVRIVEDGSRQLDSSFVIPACLFTWYGSYRTVHPLALEMEVAGVGSRWGLRVLDTSLLRRTAESLKPPICFVSTSVGIDRREPVTHRCFSRDVKLRRCNNSGMATKQLELLTYHSFADTVACSSAECSWHQQAIAAPPKKKKAEFRLTQLNQSRRKAAPRAL